MTNAVTREPTHTAPELARLAQLALDELAAQGLVIVDSRAGRDRLVVRVGPAAAVVTDGGFADSTVDGSDCSIRACGEARVVSAPMYIDGVERIGTMHVVYGGAPALEEDKMKRLTLIFARHAALSLAYVSVHHTEERRRLNRAALAIDGLTGTTHTLRSITPAVASMMRELTGAAEACITVWDDERDILRALPGAFGAEDGALQASITGPTSNPQSLGSRVFITGRPYMTNYAGHDPGIHRGYSRVFAIERLIAVPLNRGTRRIGVLILINKPTDFTLADVAQAEEIAPRVAVAVELANSVSQLQMQQRLETILADTAVAVATGLPVDECLLPAFRALCEVLEATMVALVPRDAGPPLLWQRTAAPEALERRLLADARALVEGSVGAYPQVAGDPGWAALHVPVDFRGERKAALSILRRNGQPFRTQLATVVSRLANIAALAWASESYQHHLAEIARLHERERIADELHDRVAQILFAAQLGLDSVLEASPNFDVDRERITEVRGLLVSGDRAIRDVIARTRVASDTALARRLRLEIESVEETFGVAVHLELPEDATINSASRPVADCLVKVAREATVNAAKHAGPCRISVSVHGCAEAGLTLTVIDDGLGPQRAVEADGRCGLRSLRRAVDDVGGSLEVTQAAGGFGTRVTAAFPPAD